MYCNQEYVNWLTLVLNKYSSLALYIKARKMVAADFVTKIIIHGVARAVKTISMVAEKGRAEEEEVVLLDEEMSHASTETTDCSTVYTEIPSDIRTHVIRGILYVLTHKPISCDKSKLSNIFLLHEKHKKHSPINQKCLFKRNNISYTKYNVQSRRFHSLS